MSELPYLRVTVLWFGGDVSRRPVNGHSGCGELAIDDV